MTDRFRRAAFDVLESAGLSTDVTLVRQRAGVANHVFVARGDERVVVRLGTGSDGDNFGTSAAFLEACAGKVRTQELLYLDVSRQQFEWPAMVVSWLPGRPLARSFMNLDESARAARVAVILEEIECLHGVPVERVSAFANRASWAERRRSEFEERRQAAARDPTQDASLVESVTAAWVDASGALDAAGQSVPVHDDINFTNVLFDGSSLTGIIDFDDGDAAPRDIDYWQFANVLAEGPAACDVHTIRRWFRPWYEFERGARDLAYVDELYWVMRQLTDEVSWQPTSVSRLNAAADFEALRRGDRLASWFGP